MPPLRITPDDLKAWRHQLYLGQQLLDVAAARRLMDEVERLREELAQARTTFATKAAESLEKQLQVVAIEDRSLAGPAGPHRRSRG